MAAFEAFKLFRAASVAEVTLYKSKDRQSKIEEGAKKKVRQGFDFVIVDPAKYMDKIGRYDKLWREWVLGGK